MKELNPFYILGTTGIIVTAILQMILALAFNIEDTMISFFALYAAWLAFLVIGTRQLLKEAKTANVRKNN